MFFSRTIQCIPYAYTKFRYLWGMYNADHTWKHLSLGHPQCQGQAGHVASELFEEIWTWLNMVYIRIWKVRAKAMQKKGINKWWVFLNKQSDKVYAPLFIIKQDRIHGLSIDFPLLNITFQYIQATVWNKCYYVSY